MLQEIIEHLKRIEDKVDKNNEMLLTLLQQQTPTEEEKIEEIKLPLIQRFGDVEFFKPHNFYKHKEDNFYALLNGDKLEMFHFHQNGDFKEHTYHQIFMGISGNVNVPTDNRFYLLKIDEVNNDFISNWDSYKIINNIRMLYEQTFNDKL